MKYATLLFAAVVLLAVTPAQAADEKAISDDAIYDKIRLALAGDTTVQGGGLNVEVRAGAVTLEGKVRTDKAKEKATKLVKRVKGVKSVDNKLIVDANRP
jgi:hyperosmotically inducible protein